MNSEQVVLTILVLTLFITTFINVRNFSVVTKKYNRLNERLNTIERIFSPDNDDDCFIS